MYTIGAITLVLWALRLFTIPLLESPRYLVGKGQDEKAIAVVQKIAKINKKPCSLTLEDLTKHGQWTNTSKSKFGGLHVKALFNSSKLAWSTTLMIIIWGIIGLSTTLYNSFLPLLFQIKGVEFKDGSTDITFRNTLFLQVVRTRPNISHVHNTDGDFIGHFTSCVHRHICL
jgi:hypothetical protein